MTEESLQKYGFEKNEEEEHTRIQTARQEIRRECDQAKEIWLKEGCDGIERLSNTDESVMYIKIKEPGAQRGFGQGLGRATGVIFCTY